MASELWIVWEFQRAMVQIIIYAESCLEYNAMGDKNILVLWTLCRPSSVFLWLYLCLIFCLWTFLLMCASPALGISFFSLSFSHSSFFTLLFLLLFCTLYLSPCFSLFLHPSLCGAKVIVSVWLQMLHPYTVPLRKVSGYFNSSHGIKRKSPFLKFSEKKIIYFHWVKWPFLNQLMRSER